MAEKLSSQLLLKELKTLMERCNLDQKSLADYLYKNDFDDKYDNKSIKQVHDSIRKQFSKPPKDPFIFKKYIEILRENHHNLKKDIIFPKIEPEFDNEIDQLRYNKIMEKINNMDK